MAFKDSLEIDLDRALRSLMQEAASASQASAPVRLALSADQRQTMRETILALEGVRDELCKEIVRYLVNISTPDDPDGLESCLEVELGRVFDDIRRLAWLLHRQESWDGYDAIRFVTDMWPRMEERMIALEAVGDELRSTNKSGTEGAHTEFPDLLGSKD